MIFISTLVVEFLLVGLCVNKKLRLFVFFLFLIIYMSTVAGNIIIITVIHHSPKLCNPMYFFLMNLSFLEICYTSVTIPRMMADIISEDKGISIAGCITQCYFFFVLSAIENYLLAIMAYDRYLAICNPLRYTTIMNSKLCYQLTIGSWSVGIFGSLSPIYFLSKLSFCGENRINHFFCDIHPLLNHSCSNDTYLNDLLDFICSSIVIVTSFTVTLISYLYIILTVLKIPTTKGRTKAFSTCGSHLIVVLIYYGTVIFMYVRPKVGFTFSLNRVVAVFYTVITPILNPIIYCLRNKDTCVIKCEKNTLHAVDD
uniref:Olfactory receptor n=1 Tax=Leptobrachium leishanense TaxID=445787 RepID=A0A8C5LWQ0_9ANUR